MTRTGHVLFAGFVVCLVAAGCGEKRQEVVQPKQLVKRQVQPEEIYNEALSELKAGRLDQAEKKIGKVIAAFSGKPEKLARAHHNLGVIEMKRKQWARAVEHFRKAVEADPKHKKAWLNLGVALRQLGRYKEGIEVYRKALAHFPRDVKIMNNLIMLLRLDKQYKQAQKTGHLLLARAPDNVEAYKNMALIYYDQGKYKLAELCLINAGKMLEKNRKKNPAIKDDAGIYANLGMVYWKLGKTQKALGQFYKALSIDPDNRDALLNIGAIAHRYRDYPTCVKVYKKVLEKHPEDIVAMKGLAYALYGAGNAKEAVAAFEKVLERQPDEKRAWYILGELYYNFLRDYQKAIHYYEKYKNMMGSALPNDDPVHNRLQAARTKLKMAAELKKEEEAQRLKEQKRKQELAKQKAETAEEKEKRTEKLKQMLDQQGGGEASGGEGGTGGEGSKGEGEIQDVKKEQKESSPKARDTASGGKKPAKAGEPKAGEQKQQQEKGQAEPKKTQPRKEEKKKGGDKPEEAGKKPAAPAEKK